MDTPSTTVMRGNKPVSGTATEALAPLSSDRKRNQEPRALRKPLKMPMKRR
jgi:hypothetical protein